MALADPDAQFFFTPFSRGIPATNIDGFIQFTNLIKLTDLIKSVTQDSDLIIVTMSLINPKSRGVMKLKKKMLQL